MNKLTIVMYHYVRDLLHSRYPKIRGLDVSLFQQQIQFLKNNFSIVTMEEVISACKGEQNLPNDSILLTFDDGYIDNYTFVFPILQKAGVQGSFFIPGKTFATHQLLDVNKVHYILANADTESLLHNVFERMNFYRDGKDYYPQNDELFAKYAKETRFDTREIIFIKRMLQTILPEEVRKQIVCDLFKKYVDLSEEKLAYELYMTEDQIWSMKRQGMFIGVHGYDHDWLGNLPKEKMERDIQKALDVMDRFIDRKQWVMNYPYGNYNKDVLDYIQEQGACLGLTTRVAVADLIHDHPLELPRLDCNDFPPKSNNYREII